MKKLLALPLLLVLSNFIYGQNTINVGTTSVDANSSFLLEISLENASEATAFQFDLTHDESAYELSNSLDFESSLTSRADNHSMSVSVINDNTIRVLVY